MSVLFPNYSWCAISLKTSGKFVWTQSTAVNRRAGKASWRSPKSAADNSFKNRHSKCFLLLPLSQLVRLSSLFLNRAWFKCLRQLNVTSPCFVWPGLLQPKLTWNLPVEPVVVLNFWFSSYTFQILRFQVLPGFVIIWNPVLLCYAVIKFIVQWMLSTCSATELYPSL